MARSRMGNVMATFMAGLFVLLPLTLTLALLAWLIGLLNRLIGPDTLIGSGFSTLGYTFSENDRLAYVFGTLVLIFAIYVLGLAVEAGLRGPIKRYTLDLLRRVPIMGRLYGFAEKIVDLVDRRPSAELQAMGAVWCFFGGKGAAVLALAPSHDPIVIEGESYVGVLIPTAPVPIGGALLYVPADWVRPANIGIDKLMAVYVSMGITPPIATPSSAPPSPIAPSPSS